MGFLPFNKTIQGRTNGFISSIFVFNTLVLNPAFAAALEKSDFELNFENKTGELCPSSIGNPDIKDSFE